MWMNIYRGFVPNFIEFLLFKLSKWNSHKLGTNSKSAQLVCFPLLNICKWNSEKLGTKFSTQLMCFSRYNNHLLIFAYCSIHLKLDTLSSFSDFQFHNTVKVEILEIGYILVKFIETGYRAYPISMNFNCIVTSIVRKIWKKSQNHQNCTQFLRLSLLYYV